ncbi:MAG TPA: hypothetical protein PK359_11835, partial [Burkholderiaceae bacterium]|nr:hypothetical protein [Burkholderiaceae bacterium]
MIRVSSRLLAPLVAVGLGALAMVPQAQSQAASPISEALKAVAAGKDPMPGPRSCFWARGPVSGDPYVNIAYPDAATFYWAAVFTVPEGARLTLEGRFPRSRYMSFISYDEAGRPVESVADYLIKPAAGSANPFLAGGDRSAARRDYSLAVVDARPDPNRKTG